jgi:hypothetical protein
MGTFLALFLHLTGVVFQASERRVCKEWSRRIINGSLTRTGVTFQVSQEILLRIINENY